MLSTFAPSPVDVHTRGVFLRVGLWHDHARELDVSLRALTGTEEESLGDAARWSSPAARVSALLAHAVTRIGDIEHISIDYIRALNVLDRDLLLIALRQFHFGDRVDVTLTCPNAECGKKIDLDFRLSDLPIPDRVDAQPDYEFEIDGRRISFRLPNGGDQEFAAASYAADPVAAEHAILTRCILAIDGEPATEAAALTAEQLTALGEEMDRRDPQIDNEFDAVCPECGNAFRAYFDIQDFLLREFSDARSQLYRQVHTLAWYYHWSEAEIMTLPFPKRKTYLDLLADVFAAPEEALP